MVKTPKTANIPNVQHMRPYTGNTQIVDNKPGLEPTIKVYEVDGYDDTEHG